MTDQAWYDPASADFLILTSQPYYGGTWTRQQITARFGQPAHAYHTRVFTILVWHHNLLTSTPTVNHEPAQGTGKQAYTYRWSVGSRREIVE